MDDFVYNVPTQQNGKTLYYSGLKKDAPAPSTPPPPSTAPAAPPPQKTNDQGVVVGAAPAGSKISANGNYVGPDGKQYTTTPPKSSPPSAAGIALPSGPMSEEDFFSKIHEQLAPVLDSITQAEAASENAAYAAGTQEMTAYAGAYGTRGLAGSSEAAKLAGKVGLDTAGAIASAKQWGASQTAAIYSKIADLAQGAFQFDVAQRNTMMSTASTWASQLGASGISVEQLQSENPDAYNNLLSLLGGNPEVLKAYVIAGAMNTSGGQYLNQPPIQGSDGKLYFLKRTVSPDGTPSISYDGVDLSPVMSKGQTITTINGQPYVSTPNGDGTFHIAPLIKSGSMAGTLGNINPAGSVVGNDTTNPEIVIGTAGSDTTEANTVDPTTGLTPNAIYQDALGLAFTGKMPSLGIGTNPRVVAARNAINNLAAKLTTSMGTSFAALQAKYGADKKAVSDITTRMAKVETISSALTAQFPRLAQLADAVKAEGVTITEQDLQATQAAIQSKFGSSDAASFIELVQTVRGDYAGMQASLAGGRGGVFFAQNATEAIPLGLTSDQYLSLMNTIETSATNAKTATKGEIDDLLSGSSRIGPDSSSSTVDTKADPLGIL